MLQPGRFVAQHVASRPLRGRFPATRTPITASPLLCRNPAPAPLLALTYGVKGSADGAASTPVAPSAIGADGIMDIFRNLLTDPGAVGGNELFRRVVECAWPGAEAMALNLPSPMMWIHQEVPAWRFYGR